MLRLNWSLRLSVVLSLLVVGSGSLTAGVFDLLSWTGKKTAKPAVIRAQEPNPAPPVATEQSYDPAYSQPAEPLPSQTQTPAMPYVPSDSYGSSGTCQNCTSVCLNCAPEYSGFSGGMSCPGCRESGGCFGGRCGHSLAKTSRRMSGQSYYCDCYPLFGPRYGFHTTCWRRLPEDCRCPIYLPPRKQNQVLEPAPNLDTVPMDEPQAPPAPPQVMNYPLYR